MQQSSRIILAIALSAAVLFGWNYLFPTKPAPKPEAQQTAQGPTAQPGSASQAAPAQQTDGVPAPAVTAAPPKVLEISTPLYRVRLLSSGVIERFDLNRFKETVAPDSGAVGIITDAALAKNPFSPLVGGVIASQAFAWSTKDDSFDLKDGTRTILLEGRSKDLTLIRELTFSATSYVVAEKLSITNTGSAPLPLRVGFTAATTGLSVPGNSYDPTRVAMLAGGKLTEETSTDTLAKKGLQVDQDPQFAAVMSNYFVMAVAPEGQGGALKARFEDNVFRLAADRPEIGVAPGQTVTLPCSYYFGPKEPKSLAQAPSQLTRVIDYGTFDIIAKPLVDLLRFFHGLVGNWGVAIILLTLLIKLVFWPLSKKSYSSMDKMKKLQPLINQIREKHADDRERMNAEMMQLYKTYKINPMGGCLPMIVQIPVFFGLYQALLNSIELRHASFIGHLPGTDLVWLADLSTKDPYYITPLIMGATMFIQQRLTPAPGDPTQAKVMMFMPVIFTVMFLNFPSGLVVYWLVNNVLSIAQQWMMTRSQA